MILEPPALLQEVFCKTGLALFVHLLVFVKHELVRFFTCSFYNHSFLFPTKKKKSSCYRKKEGNQI